MGIDRAAIDRDLATNSQPGVAEPEAGQPRLIVSLTSFPARICDVKYVIHSLLRQTLRPWKVILWLGIEQFPEKERDLPSDFLPLKERGLEIRFVKDTQSYKKLIPALMAFPDDVIVTADDDMYYPDDWLANLYGGYCGEPGCISGVRIHQVKLDESGNVKEYAQWPKCVPAMGPSFLHFATTGGGALFPPRALCLDVMDEALFRKLAPMADDVWFWAMAVMHGTKINALPFDQRKFKLVKPERELGFTDEPTLFKNNMIGNDAQIRDVLTHYPAILERLRQAVAGGERQW